MARITPGPNAGTLDDLMYGSMVTAADGKPAMAVTNTDGTAISGGGGGGGAVTVADGADVAEGALADAAVTAGSTGSVSGKLRQISADVSSLKTTQPLPTGGSTAANQATEIASLATIATNTGSNATAANQTNGNQQVQGNVASGAADSGNPIKMGGKFNTTLPTYSDGQRTETQYGSRGALEVQIMGAGSTTGAAISASGANGVSNSTAGINVYTLPRVYNGTTWDSQLSGGVTGMAGVTIQASPTGAYTYSHISTAATTVVKGSAGTLHAISVNSKGTVASTITVYDNTAGSGTVIGVIDSLNLYGIFILDVAFATGLTLVTTGTVAPDLTVSYK